MDKIKFKFQKNKVYHLDELYSVENVLARHHKHVPDDWDTSSDADMSDAIKFTEDVEIEITIGKKEKA